jgi:hypothetical protein
MDAYLITKWGQNFSRGSGKHQVMDGLIDGRINGWIDGLMDG